MGRLAIGVRSAREMIEREVSQRTSDSRHLTLYGNVTALTVFPYVMRMRYAARAEVMLSSSVPWVPGAFNQQVAK